MDTGRSSLEGTGQTSEAVVWRLVKNVCISTYVHTAFPVIEAVPTDYLIELSHTLVKQARQEFRGEKMEVHRS